MATTLDIRPSTPLLFDATEAGATFGNTGPSTVYYSDTPGSLTTAVNDGYLNAGDSVELTGQQWFVVAADGHAVVTATPVGETVVTPDPLDPYVLRSQLAYNVKNYGALGDGSTDDTGAIRAAITAATANGGIIFFPPGTYQLSGTLTLPNSVSYGPSITLQGSGRTSTKLRWSSDLGADEYAIKYSSFAGTGVYHHLCDMTLTGPGSRGALGTSPANMHGVGSESIFSMSRVMIELFNGGLVIHNDHQNYEDVKIGDCYYGVFFDDSGGTGDNVFRSCNLAGNLRASIGIHGDFRMSGARFYDTHFGFGPYGIYGESGSDSTLIVESLFVGCGFESIGNAWIKCADTKNVVSTTFRRCAGSVNNSYKIAAEDQKAVIDIAGEVSSCAFEGSATFAPASIPAGFDAYIKALNLTGNRWEDADNLVAVLIAGGKPFLYDSTGKPSGNVLRSPGTTYRVANASAAVTAQTLVEPEAYEDVRPFGTFTNIPFGVAVLAAASSNKGILVAVDGRVTVKCAVNMTHGQIVIPNAGTPTQVDHGTAGAAPGFGFVVSDGTAGSTCEIFVKPNI